MDRLFHLIPAKAHHATTMTTQPPAARRAPSTTTAAISAAKPPCTIHSTAIISDRAQLIGTYQVTIGENVVIHPYARIRAESGPVTIGALCTVSENAIVGLPPGVPSSEVVLERAVAVDSGAEVCAKSVGEGTEIGIGAKVGDGCVVGRYCRITPKEVLGSGTELGDYMVVFGDGEWRADKTMRESEEMRGIRMKGKQKEVETLRRLIPNAAAKWTG